MEQKEKDIIEPVNNKKKGRVWAGVAFFFVISGIALLLFIRFLASPKSGVIKVVELPKIAEKKPELVRFEGKLLSFAYSSDYVIKEQRAERGENGIISEMAYLSGSPDNPKKIALTVKDMTGKTMIENADYNLRKVYRDKYSEEKLEAGNAKGVTFTNLSDNNYEKVIFIERAPNLVILALTAQLTSREELDEEFSRIVKSIQWKD